MVDAILFDLDQTLMDRDRSLRAFLKWQWDRHDALHRISEDQFVVCFLRHDNNGKFWKDQVYAAILREFQIHALDVTCLVDEYLSEFPKFARTFPEVLDVLQRFKAQGIKLWIITNGRSDLQSAVIKACSLETLMDVILISEEEGIKARSDDFSSRPNPFIRCPSSCCFYWR